MRYRYLDSWRGIAALIVLFHHLRLAFAPEGKGPWSLGALVQDPPLKLLVDGSGAVYLFFVLSGFALTASIETACKAEGGFAYGRFAFGRVLRLYPPYAFAVLASALLCVLIQPQPVDDLSDWFNNESWALPITPRVVLGELAMLNQHQYMTLLNPGWALIHILRISFVFPLIYFALRARPLATLIAAIAVSVAANWAQAQPSAPFWVKEVGGGAQYLASFALGGWIFLARESIARVLAPPPFKLALAAGAIGFFLAPRQWPGADIWFPSIGAALGMMALLASPSAQRVFCAPVLLWLGGISFSLYLVHIVVLLSVLHLFYGFAPSIVLIAVIVALALVAAALTQRFVERPVARLGASIRGKRTPEAPREGP